jgi:hypothetical protein
MTVQNQLTRCGSRRSVNAFPSPEHNQEAVLAAMHSSAGTRRTRVSSWHRRPPGYLAGFSTFARLRPIGTVGKVIALGKSGFVFGFRFMREQTVLVSFFFPLVL